MGIAMRRLLSAQTILVTKATVPALEAHGLDVTRRMYQRPFQDPAIRDLFNPSHQGDQPKALARVILGCARNIENPGVLAAAVGRIAQKHVGLNILPRHFPAMAVLLASKSAQ
jgi:nitric oxide dioxygenase